MQNQTLLSVRAVVQRVVRACVRVEGKVVSEIGKGMLVLVGVGKDDSEDDAKYLAKRIANLRIFDDEKKKMNIDVKGAGGQVLVVSQFTLFGDVRWGNRPDFRDSAPRDIALELYRKFVEELKSYGVEVKEGVFGAYQEVELVNDGPVTILVDSKRVF